MPNFIRSLTRYLLASMFAIPAILASNTAFADPKTCITTHATGQREAKAGHLRLATQLFTKCGSDESCPSQLRQECAEFLQTVQQTVPTVIFAVLDEKNQDISTVKVFSTDELIADGLDGRAIQIDPGKHRLRFLLPWGAVLSSDVLIREGEKNRMIQVKIADEAADATDLSTKQSKQPAVEPRPTAATAPAPATPAPAPAHRGSPTAAWVVAGASVVGLGVGTTFALLGKSKKSDVNACSPNCGSDARPSYNSLKRDYLIADIGFGIGVVSAGVATWLFLAPSDNKPQASSASTTRSKAPYLHPVAFALPGGGGIVLSGGF